MQKGTQKFIIDQSFIQKKSGKQNQAVMYTILRLVHTLKQYILCSIPSTSNHTTEDIDFYVAMKVAREKENRKSAKRNPESFSLSVTEIQQVH